MENLGRYITKLRPIHGCVTSTEMLNDHIRELDSLFTYEQQLEEKDCFL